MFKNELILNTFCRDYLKMLAGDLTESDLDSAVNGKTPRWILGHLRVTADMPRAMVGLESQLDEPWVRCFGPGSSITSGTESPAFDLAQVVAETVAAYEELANAAQHADPESLAEPHGIQPLANTALKTRGDLISHLLSTHFAFHLAQLSACRQAKGNGPLF